MLQAGSEMVAVLGPYDALPYYIHTYMLQAGRSPIRVMGEVDFSIHLILPAVLWS
jgi:hypothetical protein